MTVKNLSLRALHIDGTEVPISGGTLWLEYEQGEAAAHAGESVREAQVEWGLRVELEAGAGVPMEPGPHPVTATTEEGDNATGEAVIESREEASGGFGSLTFRGTGRLSGIALPEAS